MEDELEQLRRTPGEIESWRKTFRDGFSPQFSREQLTSLRDALVRDDGRLIQGAMCSPPPMACVQDWPVEAACAIGWCAWMGEAGPVVKDVEEFFSNACYACDQLLNCPAACRFFINWTDDSPRDEMRRKLIEEIDAILAGRLEAVTA